VPTAPTTNDVDLNRQIFEEKEEEVPAPDEVTESIDDASVDVPTTVDVVVAPVEAVKV
jgi:hypothetical protein